MLRFLVEILAEMIGKSIRNRVFRRRLRRRKDSLQQDPTGMWVWIEFNGTQARSENNPDAPGGAWHDLRDSAAAVAGIEIGGGE